MAVRYVGDCTVRIQWDDRGYYRGTITVPLHGERRVIDFSDLYPPAILTHAVDSPMAYDDAARSAVAHMANDDEDVGNAGVGPDGNYRARRKK